MLDGVFSYICSYLSMKPLFIGFQAIRLPIRGTYEVVLEHVVWRSNSTKKKPQVKQQNYLKVTQKLLK